MELSDMSHEAAQHGGPEQYIRDIEDNAYSDGYDAGYDDGCDEGIEIGTLIGAGIVGFALLASKVCPKVVEWFKKYLIINEDDNEENKNILRTKAEAAKEEVIKGMKQAENNELQANDVDTQGVESDE